MPASHKRSPIPPRIIRRTDLPDFFRHSESWLAKKLPEFEKNGMPRYNPLFDGWDAKALHLWMDANSGLLEDGEQGLSDNDAAAEFERLTGSSLYTG